MTSNPSDRDNTTPITTGFISMRWRFITPVFLVVLFIAVVGAYILVRNAGGGLQVSQQNLLLSSSRSVRDRAAQHYQRHLTESQRVAFTTGLASAVLEDNTNTLRSMLQNHLQINGMDSIIITDSDGRELLGIRQSDTEAGFVFSSDAFLGSQTLVRAPLDSDVRGETGFLFTQTGTMLYTSVPLYSEGSKIGVVLVGQDLSSLLRDIQGSAIADLALFGPTGQLLETTLPTIIDDLTLDAAGFTQALNSGDQIPIRSLELASDPYQGAFQAFRFGPNTLGVIGAVMPDDVPFAVEIGRQLTALFAAAVAGGVVSVAYILVNRYAIRIGQVATVARDLSQGKRTTRTQMQPVDEVGAAGHALDAYATHVESREERMKRALRRQRRELHHLLTVFEALPDGVILQAKNGRTVMMNGKARAMVGSPDVLDAKLLNDLIQDSEASEKGKPLAPGLYALGDPRRVDLDGHMLSAQAGAVTSITGRRLGTVIMLRDITDDVRQDRERERILQELSEDVQQPLSQMWRTAGPGNDMMTTFARATTQQAVALQKLIVDMREMAITDHGQVQGRQKVISLETLIWGVANEWRQVATATGLTLHVIIEEKGLFVAGDEKRLRWALGNVVDNAIKYTPVGGALTIEINNSTTGQAQLRVRDNGVGISSDDLPNVFERFYRGQPQNRDGSPMNAPGMGQGLAVTQQIIEAHGGSVRLKSTPHIGTAVYFTLPLTAPETMQLVQLPEDMDGETVQVDLPEFVDRDGGGA